MAMPAFMKLKGKAQGDIEGSVEIEAHKGSIQVQEFKHTIKLPIETQGGQPIGHRVHEPLTIHKYTDKASPKLYKALATGERFSEVEIKWYKINHNGEEEHYFTHKLEDAVIVNMTPYMPNCLDRDREQYGHMEEVQFTYRKIVWTWVDGGVSAEDDWTNRKTK